MIKSPTPFPWDRFKDMTVAQRIQLLAERSEGHDTKHGDLQMTVQTFIGGFEKVARSVEELVGESKETAKKLAEDKLAEKEDRARWGKRSIAVLGAVGTALAALFSLESSNHGQWSSQNILSAIIGSLVLVAALVFVWVTA